MYTVKERPILVLQDGAVSHISPQLINSAMKNDVILMCMPSSATHITQPLDAAVYKAMKSETAKQIRNVKMLKSKYWVSKKNVPYSESFSREASPRRKFHKDFGSVGLCRLIKTLSINHCSLGDPDKYSQNDADLSINEGNHRHQAH